MLSKEEIIEAFQDFNSKKIMIVGDVMVDAYLWGHVERISPEAPVPIVSVNKRENRLGGAANVALNIKSLGAEPIMCSVIGKDQKGDEFMDLLKKDKLPVKGIFRSKDRITTTKFRVIGNKSQLLRVDEEHTSDLREEDLEGLLDLINRIIAEERPDGIIFQDYNKGVLTEGLIGRVIQIANENEIPVVVDPKKKNFNSFKNVSLFKPNLKELKEGLNIDLNGMDTDSLAKAMKQLHINQNIDIVMTTLSEHGVFVSSRHGENEFETHHIPAHIRSISDVSGAGDTVVSVATLFHTLNTQPDDTARIANLAGGIVCEEVGVVPIDKERLLEEAIKITEE